MDKKPSGFKARWKARYHHASIQLILSIAFTAVAVIGMLFLGMALLLRFPPPPTRWRRRAASVCWHR